MEYKRKPLEIMSSCENKNSKTTVRKMRISDVQDLYTTNSIIPMKGQRPLDMERVKIIQQYVCSDFGKPTFYYGNVVLSVKNSKEGDIYHIIDGQHRLNAINLITRKSESEFKLSKLNIVAVVYDNLTYQQEVELFKNINMAVSVPKLYLAEDEKKNILRRVRSKLYKMYGSHITATKRLSFPRFNLTMAMSEIIEKKVIDDMFEEDKVKNAREFIALIKELNSHIKEQLTGVNGYAKFMKHASAQMKTYGEAKVTRTLQEVVARAKSHGEHQCYLGFIPHCNWVNFIGNINRY